MVARIALSAFVALVAATFFEYWFPGARAAFQAIAAPKTGTLGAGGGMPFWFGYLVALSRFLLFACIATIYAYYIRPRTLGTAFRFGVLLGIAQGVVAGWSSWYTARLVAIAVAAGRIHGSPPIPLWAASLAFVEKAAAMTIAGLVIGWLCRERAARPDGERDGATVPAYGFSAPAGILAATVATTFAWSILRFAIVPTGGLWFVGYGRALGSFAGDIGGLVWTVQVLGGAVCAACLAIVFRYLIRPRTFGSAAAFCLLLGGGFGAEWAIRVSASVFTAGGAIPANLTRIAFRPMLALLETVVRFGLAAVAIGWFLRERDAPDDAPPVFDMTANTGGD